MTEEQLKAFLEKVKSDMSLQEKLKKAADNDAIVAIAKEAGFTISSDNLNTAQSNLSEEELEAVAGGFGTFLGGCNCNIFSNTPGGCTKDNPENQWWRTALVALKSLVLFTIYLYHT